MIATFPTFFRGSKMKNTCIIFLYVSQVSGEDRLSSPLSGHPNFRTQQLLYRTEELSLGSRKLCSRTAAISFFPGKLFEELFRCPRKLSDRTTEIPFQLWKLYNRRPELPYRTWKLHAKAGNSPIALWKLFRTVGPSSNSAWKLCRPWQPHNSRPKWAFQGRNGSCPESSSPRSSPALFSSTQTTGTESIERFRQQV
jgi:hypothetical protein